MSAPPQGAKSARGQTLDSSYRSWKTRRPFLFPQQGTEARPMANRTVAKIGVIAENQELIVSLPNTLYDSSLAHSIIDKSKAFATQGQIKTASPLTLTDSAGHVFASSVTITLRWRYDNGLQFFQETFYVVDGCAGYDAILRKGIETKPEEAHVPQAYPLCQGKYGKAEEREKTNREKDRKEQFMQEVMNDREKYKRQIAAAKKAGSAP